MIGASEKRSQDVEEFDQKIKVLIVDIEGTTTSISFVKDKLFPYIRENLQVYLKSHWKEPEFVEDLTLLRKQAESDKENGVEGLVPIPAGNDENDELCQAVLKNILWQMDLDRKTKALKQLQGHVMREGYMNGKLKGHVYDDVQPALKSWTHSGKQVYIYSSGSVAAQKLLFGYSEKGDLLEFFSGHFDTEIGPKVESSSYSNIAKQLNCKPEEILFLTDIPKESMAAREAGLQAVLVARPGNAPLSDDDCHKFRVVKSFDDIVFEASAKRTKLSTDEPVSQNTVSNESVKTSNSDVQMDVDDNESCSKVSEESLVSESNEEKTNKNYEEVNKLQNGNAQEQKDEKVLETSTDKDRKSEQGTEPENDQSSTSETKAEKKASKTEGKDIVSDSSNKAESCDEKVDEATKTENLKENEKVVEMETDKNESNETSSVVETVRDNKTAVNEKDEKCTVKETEPQIQGEQNMIPEETKTVEKIPENEKTELPRERITTEDEEAMDSIRELKTVVEVGKAETEPAANKEKTVGSVEESKTVDSTSEEKAAKTERISDDNKKSKATPEETTSTSLTESGNVEATAQVLISKGDEMKVTDSAKDAKVPDTLKEVPEIDKEAKSTGGAQEVEVSEVANQNRTKESSEEMKVSKKNEEAKTADTIEVEKIPEGLKSPNAAGETKVDKPVEEVKTPKSVEESKTSETPKEVTTPEIIKEEIDTPVTDKSAISKATEETKTSEVTEAKSETTSEINDPESNKKTEDKEESIPKLEEKKVSVHAKGDETMECEDESKTEEAPKTEAVENSSDSAAETKKQDLGSDEKITNVNDMSGKSENEKEDVKKEEGNKPLESSEEKVTENCDKDTGVEEKIIVDEKMTDSTEEKNGETDVDMKVSASDSQSLSAGQKAENNSTEKKVPMDVGDGEIKTSELSAKNEEAMETDVPDSGHNDVDTPMDIDSSKTAEISAANGKEESAEDSKNNGVEEKETPEAMDSKTNGINNSSETSPKVNCEKNETDSKIIDSENIKLKKPAEESDAAKLNSSPSAQS